MEKYILSLIKDRIHILLIVENVDTLGKKIGLHFSWHSSSWCLNYNQSLLLLVNVNRLPQNSLFLIEGSYRFFSSSSLLAFLLNFGSSCWRRSLTASRSFTAVLSLEKWKLVVSPACNTNWSWILAFPSGLIFWPILKRTCITQHQMVY